MTPISFVEDEQPDPRGEKRTRNMRKKKPKEAKIPGWDSTVGTWRATRKKGKRTLQTYVPWMLVIAAAFGATFFLLKNNEPKEETNNGGVKDDFDELVQVPLLLPDEDFEMPIEMPKIMQRSEAEFLALAQPLAETFLAATDIHQILPLLSDGELVKPKIIDYYQDGIIKPTGLSKFNSTGQVSYKDSFAAVTILTTDFEKRQMAFVDGADGLKIDWESWVGWSEIPWDKFIERKPVRPILVRAMLKLSDYYNFSFDDDSKWRAYRLLSPDGKHTLYAYAERNSLLDQRLRPNEQSLDIAVTLVIRFPQDGESRNQVYIDEYLSDGWVISEKAE